MERVSLEVEFVTPCFLGGADPKTTARWDAKSIRGQLRWWLRALAGGFFQGNLNQVRLAEERILGSTERKSMLDIRTEGAPRTESDEGECHYRRRLMAGEIAGIWGDPSQDTIRRLAIHRDDGVRWALIRCVHSGMGPFSKEQGFPYQGSNALEFDGRRAFITLTLRHALAPSDRNLLVDALWAWLYLGNWFPNRKDMGLFGSRQSLHKWMGCFAPVRELSTKRQR